MSLQTYFADLHIHIGRDRYNRSVKITGAKTLTLTNILQEASRRKGMDLIGIVDCHVPSVQEELKELIDQSKAYELPNGGIRFENITLLLGTEIEIYDDLCQGPIHVLLFLPNLFAMEQLTKHLQKTIKNIQLSSQRYYGSGIELQKIVNELGGLFIPAHVFTPFKSLYGKGVSNSLTEVFDPNLIDAIELGLSSDTEMADQIKELHPYEFLTNSDAHSLKKIAREYQQIVLKDINFKEFSLALRCKKGRKIVTNYGMNPLLGKYSETVCANCRNKKDDSSLPCVICGSEKIILGVRKRIEALASAKNRRKRPDYIYQVPLEYLPGLGPKTLEKLLNHFKTEMNVCHYVSYHDLKEVVGSKLAQLIVDMRTGNLAIEAGGGGKYGRIQ